MAIQSHLLHRLAERRREMGRAANYEQYLSGDTLAFCEALSRQVLALSVEVEERLNQKYILYFVRGNKFAGFEPQKTKVLLALTAVPYDEIDDPLGICKDKRNRRLSMGGEIRADLVPQLHSIDDAMNLVKQSFRKAGSF